MYEVFFVEQVVGVDRWHTFLTALMKLHNQGERVELSLDFDEAVARVFIETRRDLPHFLAGAVGFTIKKLDARPTSLERLALASPVPYFCQSGDTIISISDRLKSESASLNEVHIVLRRLGARYTFKTYLVVERAGVYKTVRLYGATDNLLNLDFRQSYLLAKPPKYLNLAKSLQLISTDQIAPVMRLDTYPYLSGEHYLNLASFDFFKHTAVFGASGSGKTKFLSQFIEQVTKFYGDQYHFLVIDPHASLADDIGGLPGAKVYDFSSRERSLDLFIPSSRDIISSVDMTLGLFKTLIGDAWNSRLTRLLRASLYLLTERADLSFQSLRRLLTDPVYKNACLAEVRDYLPESLQEFFGQDFNELKSQYYDVTFAPILAVIDELGLTPAFYRRALHRLDYELSSNKLTLVSLDQALLGEKPVCTLAGLIMNQLFALGVGRRLSEHIIMVVDEVAVVESPILLRFLSEARKYNISVVLSGQYFSQISAPLRTAIYANAANYFCFRLNYDDAEHLAKYLDLNLAGASSADNLKLLVKLRDRKLVARLSRKGVLASAVMGESLDFVPKPSAYSTSPAPRSAKEAPEKLPHFGDFTGAKSSILDLMREQSTSRKKL